jgi:hypothetical protein
MSPGRTRKPPRYAQLPRSGPGASKSRYSCFIVVAGEVFRGFIPRLGVGGHILLWRVARRKYSPLVVGGRGSLCGRFFWARFVQECLRGPFLPLQAEERVGSGVRLAVQSSSGPLVGIEKVFSNVRSKMLEADYL